MQIRVAKSARWYSIVDEIELNSCGEGLRAERALPAMHFRMAIRKGKTAGAIMICGWDIGPEIDGKRAKKTGVVVAVGVFIQINRGFGRNGILEVARLPNVPVKCAKGARFGIAIADPQAR